MSEAEADLAARLFFGALTPRIKIHLGLDLWVFIYPQIYNTKVTLGYGQDAFEQSW